MHILCNIFDNIFHQICLQFYDQTEIRAKVCILNCRLISRNFFHDLKYLCTWFYFYRIKSYLTPRLSVFWNLSHLWMMNWWFIFWKSKAIFLQTLKYIFVSFFYLIRSQSYYHSLPIFIKVLVWLVKQLEFCCIFVCKRYVLISRKKIFYKFFGAFF